MTLRLYENKEKNIKVYFDLDKIEWSGHTDKYGRTEWYSLLSEDKSLVIFVGEDSMSTTGNTLAIEIFHNIAPYHRWMCEPSVVVGDRCDYLKGLHLLARRNEKIDPLWYKKPIKEWDMQARLLESFEENGVFFQELIELWYENSNVYGASMV